MASIRFVQNINLQVTFENKESMVPFSAGSIYNAIKIEVDTEGYNNIYMPDGSVINGVASEVFENMGKRVPTMPVTVVEVIPENAEIAVTEEKLDVALLDGTIRGKDESPTTAYNGHI